MKKTLKSLVLAILLFYVPKYLFSQMWEYERKDIEEIVWTNNNYFPDEDLKPEWREKSAVILDYKLLQEFKETSAMGVGHTTLKHYKVKLLDQAAVDNFSEFYFSRNRVAYDRLFRKNFVGFRIIKPNGDIVDIDSEKEMIVEEEMGEVKKKIAVPGLQVGDILDYYIYSYKYDYQSNIKQYKKMGNGVYFLAEEQYLLPKKYPVLNLKYEILTDEDWKITLKAINGCEIKEKKTGEDEFQFLIEAKNVDEIGDLYWDYIYRTRPSFKLYVEWETNFITKDLIKKGSKFYSIREADKKIIEENVKALYDADVSGLYGDFIKYLKKNNLENISKEKKVEEYYYYLRHRFINMHLVYDAYNYGNQNTVQFMYAPDHSGSKEREISHFKFCQHFIFALKRLDIDFDYLLVVPRMAGDISEIMSTRETIPVLKINFKTPQFLYFDGKFSRYNLLPPSIEGVNCLSVSKPSKDFVFKDYTIPPSNAKNNVLSSDLNVNINDQNLDIDGAISVKGQSLDYYQEHFVSIFDFVFDENIKYNTKRWGDTTLLKDGKMKDKIIQMHKDDRFEFKKNFEEYLTNYFEIEELELNEAQKKKFGLKPEEDEFMVQYKASTDELVNKVGNNFIVKIGMLTGEQIQVEKEDLERDYDVYVPFPKSEIHKISFTIPENYELKGVDDLNKSIENEFGNFKSQATLDGNKLTISTELVINTNFVKVENWNRLAEILNSAYDFHQKEILLKKI